MTILLQSGPGFDISATAKLGLKNLISSLGVAVGLTASAPDAVLAVEAVTVQHCVQPSFDIGGGGGGVYINSGTATIVQSSFLKCRSINNGGAIYAGGGSTTTIRNTVFQSNTALYGGAVTTMYSTLNLDQVGSGTGSTLTDEHACHCSLLPLFVGGTWQHTFMW